MSQDTETVRLFAAVREFVAKLYPGLSPQEVHVQLNSNQEVRLPVPPAPDMQIFQRKKYSPRQHRILSALAGKAMRTNELGEAIGDRRGLFKEDGIKELLASGEVAHDETIGYYRPDSPPVVGENEPDE
jgi:hypothetical protein